MRFKVSLFFDESTLERVTPEQLEKDAAEMNKFNDELRQAGVYLEGEGLVPSATARTLRYGKDGKAVVTDGPFAESKEQIGGFWILECDDLDEAVEWAERAPIREGALEVRAIAETAAEAIELHKQQSQA